MIPRGFPRRSRWWIVASLAEFFSLPAIIAVTWHEWELRPLQKYDSVFIRLMPLRPSQGLVSPPDFQQDWRADQYQIWSHLDSQRGLHLIRKPHATMRNWTRRFHRNVKAQHIVYWQVKPAAITHRIRQLSHRPPAAGQQPDSSPQPEAKTPPSSLPKQPSKGRRSLQEHQGKGWGMRRPRAGTNRSRSTELIAALIARDPVWTDGYYVLYLRDPK